MTKEEQQRIIEQYERLYHRVLAVTGLYQRNPEYEDYLQMQRLQLLEWLTCYQTTEAFEEAYPLGFLFQKLIWTVRDQQRKNQKYQQLQERLVNQYEAPVEENPFLFAEWRMSWESLWPRLTEKEQNYFKEQIRTHVEGHERKSTTTRQTLSYQRRRFKQRFLENF